MNKIYENIKAIRQAKGLTQTYLAEKVGIAINNYGKLERGEIQLTIERLEQLAEIFGMTVIEIMQYGSGVESVKVDSEKVKELEKEIKDLKEKIQSYEKIMQDTLEAHKTIVNLTEGNKKLYEQIIDMAHKTIDILEQQIIILEKEIKKLNYELVNKSKQAA
jgi:transcriptional regulator with XRE-family HTH domain